MKIVITGYKGFVASHTIPLIEEKGLEWVGVDIKEGMDICNPQDWKHLVDEGDKIFHLAAIARFADADNDPAEAWRTNVGGTAMVLDVARERKAERVVYSSTGSALMPVWYNPIREATSDLKGNSHYGFSKRMAEEVFKLYPEVPFVILRYGHLYGEGKIGHGAINSFLERMERGLKPVIYGGGQSNEFCYVKDVAQANVRALETEFINDVYNVGYGKDYTIQEVYDIINKVLDTNIEAEYKEQRTVDAPFFKYDIGKIKRCLGYEPQWDLEAGIRDMIHKEVAK